MRAGRLRHEVTIQQPTLSQDGTGDPVPSWSAFATVWAAVEPASGRERFLDQQRFADTSHVVTLRYLPGLLPTMRVLFGSRVLRILAILNIDERGREHRLLCQEVLGA